MAFQNFEIRATDGKVYFKESPDYESKEIYTFSVTASDSSSSDTETVILTINDTNDAPSISSTRTGTIIENSDISAVVYDVDALDIDGDSLTYSLVGDIQIHVVGEGANGTVTIDLFEEIAPLHAGRITELATSGSYNGVVFHRVIDGFMAQTGDVQYGQLDAGWSLAGRGGSDQPNLPAEFSQTPFDRGIVGMARSQIPDSANSQFFIMFKEAYHLNGNYTVVGRVTAGMEVVDAIKKGDGPNGALIGQPDVMKSVNSIDELLHINSETGEVTLKAPADFDKNPKYTFTVEVSDGTLTDYQTVTLSVSDEDSFVTGSVITRSEMAQTDIDVSIYTSPENLDILSTQVVSTNETGSFSIELDNGLQVSTAIELAYSSSTKAISSQDALDALKLSVGLSTSAGTNTAFDYISADFNQDGKVSSQDALSILKYSVGLTTPEQAKWVFVDTSGDYTGVSKSNTSYTEGVSIADLSADTTVSLTGILIGDVNDSYSGLIA